MKKVKKVMAVALVMTILFIVPVYASSATFYPGGYPTDCELYFENLTMDAVATMDSSFEAEMEIDGIAY